MSEKPYTRFTAEEVEELDRMGYKFRTDVFYVKSTICPLCLTSATEITTWWEWVDNDWVHTCPKQEDLQT